MNRGIKRRLAEWASGAGRFTTSGRSRPGILHSERRVLREGLIPVLWPPPALDIAEQLGLIFREFGLSPGHPRRMACGGELQRTDKEALRDRIPPRTYRWLDEYFLCADCGKLFWHGTHWLNIQQPLGSIPARVSERGPTG